MLIRMQQIHFIRKGKTIINDVNWEVEKGQHWAILGMNGAGKTTLLNLVCGYLFPSKGTIQVFGKTFGQVPLSEIKKQIGWVSLAFAERMRYHINSTGLQIVLSGKFASIGLYEQPSQEDVKWAEAILEQLGIERLRDQPYENMSQGEKQRIMIGRAWMSSPRILILDEPCSGLDFLTKEQLLTTVEQMADQQKTTILYVTHQLDEILPIFQHTLLLKNGEIFSKGRTSDQLTSKSMSQFCDTAVQVSHQQGRFHLSLAQGDQAVKG